MPSIFVLLVFLVLAEGAGMKNISLIRTGLDTDADNYAVNSLLMSSFTIAFIMFLIGIVAYIGNILLGWFFPVWFPSAYLDFVDICSLANFSIVTFDEDLNGHYIHG